MPHRRHHHLLVCAHRLVNVFQSTAVLRTAAITTSLSVLSDSSAASRAPPPCRTSTPHRRHHHLLVCAQQIGSLSRALPCCCTAAITTSLSARSGMAAYLRALRAAAPPPATSLSALQRLGSLAQIPSVLPHRRHNHLLVCTQRLVSVLPNCKRAVLLHRRQDHLLVCCLHILRWPSSLSACSGSTIVAERRPAACSTTSLSACSGSAANVQVICRCFCTPTILVCLQRLLHGECRPAAPLHGDVSSMSDNIVK